MVDMNWFAGQKLRHRCREQTYGHQGGKAAGGWGGDELGKKKKKKKSEVILVAQTFEIWVWRSGDQQIIIKLMLFVINTRAFFNLISLFVKKEEEEEESSPVKESKESQEK